jgi:hypothetical protein
MPIFIFDYLLLETGDRLITEDGKRIMLETQTNTEISIGFTNLASVDELPRIVYVKRGE